MATIAGQMTMAEFERLEDTAEEVELLEGELVRLPPPQRNHMGICELLFELLKAAVERLRTANPEMRLGRVHIEMGYRILSGLPSWLRPDVSLTHPEQPGSRYYEGSPLLAFEIVSENDKASQLHQKVAVFLANGAAEVWLIYPDAHCAWVYRQGTGAATQETSIHTDLLLGVEIPLADIL